MDLGKMFKLSLVPAGVMILLSLVSIVISIVPVLNFLVCLTGPIGFVISLAVLGWAGYNAVKVGGLDVVGAAGVGAIAGGLSSFASGIVQLIVLTFGIGALGALGGDVGEGALGAGVGAAIGVIAVILGTILGLIVGAVLGAIGGFIAGKGGATIAKSGAAIAKKK